MKRRNFFAALFAPLAARWMPKRQQVSEQLYTGFPYLELYIPAGERIDVSCMRASDMAQRENMTVMAHFNMTRLICYPGEDSRTVERRWQMERWGNQS